MTRTSNKPSLDPMLELLLTVQALSEERYRGPLSHAIPGRLAGPLRRARDKNMVHVDRDGIYLEEEGCAYLDAWKNYLA